MDVANVLCAVGFLNHYGKKSFRPVEVGVDGSLAVFCNVFTSTCIHLSCCAACCRVLLPDALPVVAVGDLQEFIPFGDGGHLVEGIVGNALLLRRENAGGGSGGGEGDIKCGIITHATNVEVFVCWNKICLMLMDSKMHYNVLC